MSAAAVTYFTQVTPVGRSAIATVVISGPAAVRSVNHFFESVSGEPLHSFALCRILFGKWQTHGSPAEDLVVSKLTEDRVEVHCHGGIAAVDAIAESLRSVGCIEKPWQQLVQSDGSEYTAAAWNRVPFTTTLTTTQIALRHATGEIDRLLEQVRTKIAAGDLVAAANLLKPYIGTSELGEHVVKPFVVVLAGRPNAGKSSLLNAISGFTRAMVDEHAGTTRDVLQHESVLEGWPVLFLDTAGLHDEAESLEKLGVERAEQALQQADLLLWIHDVTEDWFQVETAIEADLAFRNYILVVNKTDRQSPAKNLPVHFPISANSGQGIPELLSEVIERLAPGAGDIHIDSWDEGHHKVLLTREMDRRFSESYKMLQAGEKPCL